ncbi:flagellar filament capping protein FliD [Verminephrobacter eiseniae]|uniref:flagellar filament capping protein FliD n=1 Tax=Verminephrobacter eiseniae TaxID=364317 RepID=UPI0010D4773F|nr:flagellar filament capping protein FliD [Verminephrobacter eiseniae]KAB7613583.1 flagellar filament capping protein FliD [Verminephrobacter sp. Larva24]MCW5230463.1 flagellar cap protein FliD [Verminephrobacter eiseniae]MCW5260333.1 flagellar cap protein FliD [Verminephrobacter eiseniae]MCW5292196.1 flagellar cap protein FliD [Verminephrobacter eiseniae]MCW8184356.1 flagellar cap protein FliD [Verminephrobacter eiseniae]
MATISSPGIGSSGLDVKNIISQLVALERKPLDALKQQATTVNTKISAFGQLKSLVATLDDSTRALASVTGWNSVSTASSDSKYVSATAPGGTLPTRFDVEVQSLAKAQATASGTLLPVGAALRAGTLRMELGQWSVAPHSFIPASGQPVDIRISAGDKLADVASKINGAGAGVSAAVLSDPSGERLLLRSQNTGQAAGFRLSVLPQGAAPGGADGAAADTAALGLSSLATDSSTVTQAAADAQATVNGIAVTSASNTFASTVSGVGFQALQVTQAPVEISVSKDDSATVARIGDFVKAYNAINDLLQDATKYDAKTRTAGLLQGDATALALQNSLLHVLQSVSTSGGAFQRLADVGITQQLGGALSVDTGRLNRALAERPGDVKNLLSSTGGGSANGIAVQMKALTSALLSGTGFFQSKYDTLQQSLARNSRDQAQVNAAADAFEQRITQRYNALDTQLSSLNGLNAYISQQVAIWNKPPPR